MNKNKILSICLATTMIVNALPMTVFASSIGSSADNTNIGEDTAQNAKTQYTEIAESNAQTQVYLTVSDSDLIVSLPTTVIVSGTPDKQGQYVGNYSIGVKGDMTGDKTVNIEPDNTDVELIQKGKTPMSATIQQNQTEFTTDDFKNNAQTTGIVSADRLTAGSWNGEFNFNININKINSYYSSLNLAVADINNNSVGTKNTLADLYTAENAVCGVYKTNDEYKIIVYKDIPQQTSVTTQKNTKIELNNHNITFENNNYLTYTKDFSIYNGTINSSNSQYVIFSDENNTNSTFEIKDVVINNNITESISTHTSAIDVCSSNINSNNLTIIYTGNGNSSYGATGFVARNNTPNSIDIDDFTFNSSATNCSRIRGMIIYGSAVINNPNITIVSSASSVQGIGVTSTTTNIVIDGADIDINAKSTKNIYGINCQAVRTTIKNSNIYVDVDNLNGIGISTNTSSDINEYTIIDNCIVYGKEWAINTSPFGKTEIRNISASATDHSGYICGNTDVYDSEFYIANRAGQPKKDNPYGLYLGSPNGLEDYVVNFTRCKFNNGKEHADSAVSTKTNGGYIAPAEVNFYDCELYRTITASTGDPGKLISYNYTFKNWKGRTKFNLYGTTKIMDDDGTEWTKDKFDKLNATWRTTSSFHKATGLYDESLIGNGLAGGFVANVDPNTGVINEVYLTDDAGIYDYR